MSRNRVNLDPCPFLHIEKQGSVLILNQSYCSFDMTLRLMTLDRCPLHDQVSRADRLDSFQQMFDRLAQHQIALSFVHNQWIPTT